MMSLYVGSISDLDHLLFKFFFFLFFHEIHFMPELLSESWLFLASGTTAYLEQSIPYPKDGKQVRAINLFLSVFVLIYLPCNFLS